MVGYAGLGYYADVEYPVDHQDSSPPILAGSFFALVVGGLDLYGAHGPLGSGDPGQGAQGFYPGQRTAFFGCGFCCYEIQKGF